MRIFIKSNFEIPDLGEEESIEYSGSQITLRALLEKLSGSAPSLLVQMEPGTPGLNTQDYQVEINGRPFEGLKEGLDYLLRDGDSISIYIVPIGGG